MLHTAGVVLGPCRNKHLPRKQFQMLGSVIGQFPPTALSGYQMAARIVLVMGTE